MKHEITERVFPLIQVDNAKHLTRSFGLLLLVFKTQKHKHRYIRRKQRFVRQYIISSSRKEGEKWKEKSNMFKLKIKGDYYCETRKGNNKMFGSKQDQLFSIAIGMFSKKIQFITSVGFHRKKIIKITHIWHFHKNNYVNSLLH
jgi:hypothetical protein